MGMDLMSGGYRKNTPQMMKDYIEKDKENPSLHLHYNWSGWSFLVEHLNQWGVDTSEFSGINDGELISRDTCEAVAEALKSNLHTLSTEDQEWIKEDIIRWKWTKNYKQY